MDNFEARITRLEDQAGVMQQSLARIEAKLDGASKKEDLGNLRAEMHNLLRQQIMWSVGTIIATAGLVFAIVRFLSS